MLRIISAPAVFLIFYQTQSRRIALNCLQCVYTTFNYKYTLHRLLLLKQAIARYKYGFKTVRTTAPKERIMDLHSKDKTQHPENVELLSAQPPITDFKGLLTTIISAVV